MATPKIPAGFKLVPNDDEQPTTPKAKGKAAALSSYLAKMGSPSGKKLDRRIQKFEELWAKSPDALKNKYARKGNDDLAPIERPAGPPKVTNATLNASRPGETGVQTQERFRQGRVAKERGTTPAPVAAPAAAPSFAELTKAPALPEGGVKSVGAGSSAEAEAIRQGKPMTAFERNMSAQNQARDVAEGRALAPGATPATSPAIAKQSDEARVAAMPSTPVDQSTPIGRMWDQSVRDTKRQIGAVVDWVKSPVVSDVATAQAAKASADTQATQQRLVDSAAASRQKAINDITGGAPAAAPAASPQQQAAQAPAQTQAAPAAPVAGQPPIAGPTGPPELTGKHILKNPPKGVSSLTGLPMGFRPGDALDNPSPQMQQRANDSQARQSIAQANAPTPPIAAPKATIAPAPVRYADAQQQYQAGKEPAAAMDKIAAGASSIDQARIAAESLKRNAAPARRPVLAR